MFAKLTGTFATNRPHVRFGNAWMCSNGFCRARQVSSGRRRAPALFLAMEARRPSAPASGRGRYGERCIWLRSFRRAEIKARTPYPSAKLEAAIAARGNRINMWGYPSGSCPLQIGRSEKVAMRYAQIFTNKTAARRRPPSKSQGADNRGGFSASRSSVDRIRSQRPPIRRQHRLC